MPSETDFQTALRLHAYGYAAAAANRTYAGLHQFNLCITFNYYRWLHNRNGG